MSQEILNIQNEKLEVRREYWLTHFEEWKRSGLGQVEYCKKTGVKYERLNGGYADIRKVTNFYPYDLFLKKQTRR